MSLSRAGGSHERLEERAARPARPARGFSASVLILFLFICAAPRVFAQGAPLLSSSYITPFPTGDRYQMRVLGDWLASGLASGLQDAFKNDSSVQIADMSRPGYGLVRAEQTDLHGAVDRMLAGTPRVDVAIVMLGVNDRISMRAKTGRAQPGTEEWKELYGNEAGKLTKKLRAAGIAVYWVGLPAMNNPALNEFVAGLNDTIRQAAYINGAKFIESAAGFTGQGGAYSAWGPDVTGQTKRLREGDGVGLTAAGSRKLASYVETALRRDLAQARAQRNIPLAGDEEEQARVVPQAARGANAAKSAPVNEAKQDGPASPQKRAEPNANPAPAAKPGAFKTAISSSPASAQDTAPREQAAFAGQGAPQGELILGDLGDGLTSIALISPVSDLSIREILRQTPLADRLYFKVLSKGEALPAKEGRADDFRWRGNENAQSQ